MNTISFTRAMALWINKSKQHNHLHVILPAGYIFNTEAHPIDIGKIHCSSPLRLTYIPEELFRTRDMLIENSQELNYESNEDLNDEEDVEKTFTAAYTCKRFSVLGAFFEGSEEAP